MPRVTLKTLQADVLAAAIAVAEENETTFDSIVPPEGTSYVTTEADRRLWQAARRLRRWKLTKR